MALVHELLYKSENLADIDMKEYFEVLCVDLSETKSGGAKVSLDLNVDQMSLNIDEAVPLGLIANELVTNALKHAFKGRTTGTIRLSLITKDDSVAFSVSDDGIGTPDGKPPEQSLGLTLIEALATQLGSALIWDWSCGTRASLAFNRHRFFSPSKNDGIMEA